MSRDNSAVRKSKPSKLLSNDVADNRKKVDSNDNDIINEDEYQSNQSTSTVFYTPQQSAEIQEIIDEKTAYETMLANARQKLIDSGHPRRQSKQQKYATAGSSSSKGNVNEQPSSAPRPSTGNPGTTSMEFGLLHASSDHGKMVLSDHSRLSDQSRLFDHSYVDDDDVSLEIDENPSRRDYFDLTQKMSYAVPSIEAQFRSKSPGKEANRWFPSDGFESDSSSIISNRISLSSESSASSESATAVLDNNNAIDDTCNGSQTPQIKRRGKVGGFGTKKFPSIQRRNRLANTKRSKEKKSKDQVNEEGQVTNFDNLDSSWRSSHRRRHRRSQSISTTATSKTWKRNNNNNVASSNIDSEVNDKSLSPMRVSSLGQQQQNQQNKDLSGSTGKDSRIFGFIRSWGRDKSVLDPITVDDSVIESHGLLDPPNLGIKRNLSGPLPSPLLHNDFGNQSLSKLESPNNRTKATRSSNNNPARTDTQSASLSPTIDFPCTNNDNRLSTPIVSSPHEKQRPIRQQLLSQIRLQKATLSPRGVVPNVADLSSEDNDSIPDGGNDDDDANEETSFESDDVSDDDDTFVISDAINWGDMPALPNRFCQDVPSRDRQQSSIPGSVLAPPQLTACNDDDVLCHMSLGPPRYLDAAALNTKITKQEADPFVQEQKLLLQAVMQLLAERDQVGVEGSMDSSDNIWKKGPLRLLFFTPLISRRKTNNKRPVAGGVWKSRYVELRHGNLCYYEDSGTENRRSTIHLRQADTTVRDSSQAQNTRGQNPPGYCFEVSVQGTPTTVWMASSEEERQAWVRAIQSAMIGEDATTNNSPRRTLDLAPYQESLHVYAKLRELLQLAASQEMYLAAIHSAMKEVESLQIPIEWVREQMEQDVSPLLLGKLKPPKYSRSPQKALKSSLTEFWRNMRETTFSINGLTIPRRSYMAPERVIGALTRAILEFDKAFVEWNKPKEETDLKRYQMSELQAISYARNILLATLRSKERNDAACAAKYLLENAGLVNLEKIVQGMSPRDSEEIVYIEVSFVGTDLSDDFLPDAEEMACWVLLRTRRPPKKIAVSNTGKPKYMKTFAVLSGALLSFYGAAKPRPHGLKGQLALLSGSTVKDEGVELLSDPVTSNKVESDNIPVSRYMLSVCTPGQQDRLLAFENHADLLAWKEAINLAIESAGSIKSPPRVVTTTTTRPMLPKRVIAKGVESAIMVAEAGTKQGLRAIKGAKDIGIRAIKTSTDGGIKVIKGAVGMLLPVKGDQEEQGKLRRLFLKKMPRRPSMHILLTNTIVTGRREPSVQCVIQTMQAFCLRDPNATEHGTDHSSENETSHQSTTKLDGWMTIQTKLFQAFLMSGGPSGRIARGVALVEIDFVETNVDEELDDDDIEFDDDERILLVESNDEKK